MVNRILCRTSHPLQCHVRARICTSASAERTGRIDDVLWSEPVRGAAGRLWTGAQRKVRPAAGVGLIEDPPEDKPAEAIGRGF
jgi:hypothetical protein